MATSSNHLEATFTPTGRCLSSESVERAKDSVCTLQALVQELMSSNSLCGSTSLAWSAHLNVHALYALSVFFQSCPHRERMLPLIFIVKIESSLFLKVTSCYFLYYAMIAEQSALLYQAQQSQVETLKVQAVQTLKRCLDHEDLPLFACCEQGSSRVTADQLMARPHPLRFHSPSGSCKWPLRPNCH